LFDFIYSLTEFEYEKNIDSGIRINCFIYVKTEQTILTFVGELFAKNVHRSFKGISGQLKILNILVHLLPLRNGEWKNYQDNGPMKLFCSLLYG